MLFIVCRFIVIIEYNDDYIFLYLKIKIWALKLNFEKMWEN